MILRRLHSHARLAAPLATLALAGCLATPAPRRTPVERLPADSLALLREALRRARPAYATQAEALRSGAYQRSPSEAPRLVGVPAPLSGGTSFVIQILAHRDRVAAELAARQAEARFPGQRAHVEMSGDIFRVSLGAWQSEAEAAVELARVRSAYPDAWLRRVAP